jgi:syntaxin 1B/2/3
VSSIADLHSRLLNTTDEALVQQNATALDELVAETRSLSNHIKSQIQELEKETVPQGQDVRIRQNQASEHPEACLHMSLNVQPQTSLIRSKFIEALQNYQQVEQQYRTRYRQRVERQFKIGALNYFFNDPFSHLRPTSTPVSKT